MNVKFYKLNYNNERFDVFRIKNTNFKKKGRVIKMFKTSKDNIMNAITDCIKNNDLYGYGYTSIIVDRNGNCFSVWFNNVLDQHYEVRTGNAIRIFSYANRSVEDEKYDSDNEYEYVQDRVLAMIDDSEHLLYVTND